MQKTLKIVIGLLLVASISGKTVRLICEKVATTECASGYKYRALGDGLDQYTCVQGNLMCDVAIDNTLQVANCSVDYKNNPCTTGACFYAPTKSTCTADFGSACPVQADVYQYGCANCMTINNCAKCLTGMKNGNQNQAQICLGSTCNTIISVNSTVSGCSRDSLGYNCTCCATTDVKAPICTKQNSLLSVDKINMWITGKSTTTNTTTNNTTNNSGLFEHKMQLVFVCLMVILGLIL